MRKKDFVSSILKNYPNCQGRIISVYQLKEIIGKKKYCICTGCTKKKKTKKPTTPVLMYDSVRTDIFFKYCMKNNLTHAILSGRTRGIFFSDEIIEWYDVNPKFYTDEEYREIGNIIKTKCETRNINTLIVYGTSVLQARRVFRWVENSGLPWYFITKLPSLQMLPFF